MRIKMKRLENYSRNSRAWKNHKISNRKCNFNFFWKERNWYIILDKSPKACVTHCRSHNLNLSIAHCANIQVINNIIEQYKALQIYFQTSPKRKSLSEHIVSLRLHVVCQRKVLLGIRSTRWSEGYVLYEHFYLAIQHMVEAFGEMEMELILS